MSDTDRPRIVQDTAQVEAVIMQYAVGQLRDLALDLLHDLKLSRAGAEQWQAEAHLQRRTAARGYAGWEKCQAELVEVTTGRDLARAELGDMATAARQAQQAAEHLTELLADRDATIAAWRPVVDAARVVRQAGWRIALDTLEALDAAVDKLDGAS